MTEATAPQSFSVAALLAGDRTEFARLVDATSGPIYRLALRMVDNPQDAEDILQETYLKALKALPGFEGRSSLTTWLYRIAVNESLMHLRKRRPDVFSLDTSENESDEEADEPVQVVDWCCMPEAELLSTETRTFLDAAVQQLSPNLRVVFLMRDIEKLSIQETAEALGLSEVAVKARLLRARLQLREQLSAYFAERLPRPSEVT
jgi:RNA polymerase sigma-70 factor (ECF subfamily)